LWGSVKENVESGLTERLDPADVQLICALQLKQLVAACDVATVQSPVGYVPRIVQAAVQSDGQSLSPKLCQNVIDGDTWYFHR
jgi:hypothetical protein